MARNADGRALAYSYENGLRLVARTGPGALGYAYERSARLPARLGPAATSYAYENAIPADPNQLFVYDESLGEYVHVPWFVYNLETGQWQQVV